MPNGNHQSTAAQTLSKIDNSESYVLKRSRKAALLLWWLRGLSFPSIIHGVVALVGEKAFQPVSGLLMQSL